MTLRIQLSTWFLLLTTAVVSCVDPATPTFKQTVDVIVVDGTLTDLAEPQLIRLNRSKADLYTGRFGTTPLTGARVQVVVNATEVLNLRETATGSYALPDGFRGKVGNRYRLRFQLADGTGYESLEETLPAVPPIDRITDRYNPSGISYDKRDKLLASNDLYIETKDPADTPNFYRWDWVLWERQTWCHTCANGYYYEYDAAGKLLEDCVPFPATPRVTNYFDYECRTQCWEILYSNQLNLYADTQTNGRPISGYKVAQIPFYQYYPALVEVRQSALTAAAYGYYKLLDELAQRTAGLTDTPPAAPIGNVRSLTNSEEPVVGYFTASGVSAVRYWLPRRNVTGNLPFAPGTQLDNIFFSILNQRGPQKENLLGGRGRPPLAVCVSSDHRTPIKPNGWQE